MDSLKHTAIDLPEFHLLAVGGESAAVSRDKRPTGEENTGAFKCYCLHQLLSINCICQSVSLPELLRRLGKICGRSGTESDVESRRSLKRLTRFTGDERQAAAGEATGRGVKMTECRAGRLVRRQDIQVGGAAVWSTDRRWR